MAGEHDEKFSAIALARWRNGSGTTPRWRSLPELQHAVLCEAPTTFLATVGACLAPRPQHAEQRAGPCAGQCPGRCPRRCTMRAVSQRDSDREEAAERQLQGAGHRQCADEVGAYGVAEDTSQRRDREHAGGEGDERGRTVRRDRRQQRQSPHHEQAVERLAGLRCAGWRGWRGSACHSTRRSGCRAGWLTTSTATPRGTDRDGGNEGEGGKMAAADVDRAGHRDDAEENKDEPFAESGIAIGMAAAGVVPAGGDRRRAKRAAATARRREWRAPRLPGAPTPKLQNAAARTAAACEAGGDEARRAGLAARRFPARRRSSRSRSSCRSGSRARQRSTAPPARHSPGPRHRRRRSRPATGESAAGSVRGRSSRRPLPAPRHQGRRGKREKSGGSRSKKRIAALLGPSSLM